jgi:hypothetical protein
MTEFTPITGSWSIEYLEFIPGKTGCFKAYRIENN